MKRILIFVCLFICVGSWLWAGSQGTKEDKPIQLTIAWWGSQSRHDRTIKVIEQYMAEHPNVKITYEFAGFTDYWTKLTTMAAGGNLPDLIQHDYSRLSDWINKKLIIPLDGYIKDKVIDLSHVEESAISGGRVNGKLYGLSLGMNSQCFIVDLDAFEKAGLQLPPQDWTWDDFEKLSLQIKNKLNIYGLSTNLLNETIWQAVYLGNGEWSYSRDGRALGYQSDDLLVKHMKMYLRLVKAGAYPPKEVEIANQNTTVEQSFIVTKESAMDYMWSNNLSAVANAAGEGRHFDMIHIPRQKRGGPAAQYLKPSMFFSITSQARHPEEAARFIDYFTNDLEANKVLMGERGVPISSAIREGLTPLLDNAAATAFKFISKVAKDSSPIPPPEPAGHQEIINNVYNPEVMEPMAFGKITPGEAAALLRKKATEILQSK